MTITTPHSQRIPGWVNLVNPPADTLRILYIIILYTRS